MMMAVVEDDSRYFYIYVVTGRWIWGRLAVKGKCGAGGAVVSQNSLWGEGSMEM